MLLNLTLLPPGSETSHVAEYTCPGVAWMRSNASCWSWRFRGLSVTPRTGVRVDLQPDGFVFPHSLACFLIDADTQAHPISSKKSGFQDNPLYFCMTGDMKMESDEERGDLKYLPWLVSKPSTISEERTPCIGRFFFFFFSPFSSSTWGQKGHTYLLLRVKTGQGSQTCAHTNRSPCFLTHLFCCSCLLREKSWSLLSSLSFDLTPCKQLEWERKHPRQKISVRV